MKTTKRGNSYRIQKMINGKRHSISFDHNPTKREIEEAVANIRHSSVTQKSAPNTNFNIVCEDYIALKDKVLSPTTLANYKSIVRNMPDWLLELPLCDIDQIIIQKAVNEYSAAHSPKSVRNYHGFIAAVLSVYNPQLVVRTTLPMKVDKEDYIPTKEDITKILEAVDGTRYYIPLKLACYGLRRSEILAIQYPADFDGNIVSVNKAMVMDSDRNYVIKANKTTKSNRTIYIDDDLLNRIKEQGYVYNGHPDKINQHLQKVQARLEMPKFNLHKLRHYFASEMSRIMPEADWLKLGGWASPNIAKSVYRHNRIDHDTEMKQKASEHLF